MIANFNDYIKPDKTRDLQGFITSNKAVAEKYAECIAAPAPDELAERLFTLIGTVRAAAHLEYMHELNEMTGGRLL